MASFTKEVNLRLAKGPLVFNGRLANRRLTNLVKEATGVNELSNLEIYITNLNGIKTPACCHLV